MIEDDYGNFWFIHNGNDMHSNIFISNNNGIIMGMIRKSQVDPILPGTFSNLILAKNNRAIYVTGGVFDFELDPPQGWVMRIPYRAKSTVRGSDNVEYWLNPDLLESMDNSNGMETKRLRNDVIENCAKSFATIGSCHIESFLSE